MNPTATGIFGSGAAVADGPLPTHGTLKLPKEPPYRTTGLNFYLGPLMDLRCGGRRDGSHGDFWTGRGAKALAAAFEDACRQSRCGQAAIGRLLAAAGDSSSGVNVNDVRAVAPTLALGRVPSASALHAPLVSTLFAHDGPTAAKRATRGWARSQALGICLDIAQQSRGDVEGKPIDIVRRSILTGYLAPQCRYDVPDGYRLAFSAMRRLYERHLLQLALYGLWREVVLAIEHAPSGACTMARLADILRGSVITGASSRHSRWLGEDPLDASVESLLRRCARDRRRRRKGRPWSSGEEDLALDISGAGNRANPSVAAPAFALLLRVAESWMHRTRSGSRRVAHEQWLEEGGRDRLSLNVVCNDLASRTSMTAAALIDWVLGPYVVGQSLRATVAKGPQTQSGEYIYFIVPDSGGYRINQPPRLANYLRTDSARLRIALRMLEQLDLVSSTPRFKITVDGRRLLGRLRTVHNADEGRHSDSRFS